MPPKNPLKNINNLVWPEVCIYACQGMDPWGGLHWLRLVRQWPTEVCWEAQLGAQQGIICCLNVIVRNCGKRYYVRGVWNRDDQQVPDYKAGAGLDLTLYQL